MSYRKKDRRYANELMRTIHSISSLRNVSIWFDEFMSSGEKWNDQIGNALKQSDVFLLMDSTENKLAFLSVSEDESDWEYEKLALEKGRPFAVVVDLDEMTAGVKQIRYKIVNGGPIFVD